MTSSGKDAVAVGRACNWLSLAGAVLDAAAVAAAENSRVI
jgi:hypothetical protein